jgi:hypothetical protein
VDEEVTYMLNFIIHFLVDFTWFAVIK